MTPFILTLVLACAGVAESPPDRLQEAQALYHKGGTRYEAADYLGAIEAFTEALQIVDEEGGTFSRLPLLWNIARAREKQFAIDRDITHLRQALVLYRNYYERVPDAGDAVEAHERIEDLERKIRAYAQIQKGKTSPVSTISPPPPPPVEAPDLGRPTSWKVGVGLLSSGAAVTVGGVAVFGYGASFRGRASRSAEQVTGGDREHPAWDQSQDYIAAERRRGAVVMGVGGALAAAGVAGVVVGALQVRKSKVKVAPSYGGVVLSGRF